MNKLIAYFTFCLVVSAAGYSNPQFIRVFKDGNSVKLDIPDSLLGKPILFGSRIVDISSPRERIYAAGTMGSGPGSAMIPMRFEKRDSLIVIVVDKGFIEVDADDPITGALEKNMRVGALVSFPIISTRGRQSISRIDVTKFFSDEVQLSWPLPANEKIGRLDPRQTSILGAVGYNDRVNIRTYYEFFNGSDKFTITVQYFFLRLPDKPLTLRYNDERINYQGFSRKRYASGESITTKRYINRWRVEPSHEDKEKHARGILVNPRKQIILYIEPYFPQEWIPYIKEGVEIWNKAFESIGFKNVLVAREFPENKPRFDPYDIKNNIIRYIPSEVANAKGEIWTDPRSGEILAGDVLWWNNVVNLFSSWRFAQTAAVDPAARKLSLDLEQLGPIVRYAIAHEVGHMLGLQHNFRGSYAYPVDSLRSPTFTRQFGTSASVMDYARFNYVAQPGDIERGVSVEPLPIAPFDLFAIEYGYSYFHGVETPDDEIPLLESLFQQKAGDPMYMFSPSIVSGVPPDPSALSGALGNDLIASANYGILNTRITLDSLVYWTLAHGGTLSNIAERYNNLSDQYFRLVKIPMAYIGGVYTYYGPPEINSPRNVPVSKQKQKEALVFVVNSLKELPASLNNSEIAGFLGSKKDEIIRNQADVIETLLGNFIIPKVFRNTAFNSDPLPLDEYLDNLNHLILLSSEPSSEYDRNIQIAYVNNLAQLANPSQSGTTPTQFLIAQIAYNQLEQTRKNLEQLSKKYPESKSHFSFLLRIIEGGL